MRKRISDLLDDPSACIIWAMMLLLLPLRWLIAVIAAALFHELCHYAAVVICGGRVRSFRATGGSMIMDVSFMNWNRELLCAVAGPLGSLMLLLMIRRMPLVGFCAGIQLAYNMIPVYPLDGGRIFRCTCNILFPNRGEYVWLWFERAMMLLVFIASILLSFRYKLGFLPVLIALTIVLRPILGKIPCKPAVFRVQ